MYLREVGLRIDAGQLGNEGALDVQVILGDVVQHILFLFRQEVQGLPGMAALPQQFCFSGDGQNVVGVEFQGGVQRRLRPNPGRPEGFGQQDIKGFAGEQPVVPARGRAVSRASRLRGSPLRSAMRNPISTTAWASSLSSGRSNSTFWASSRASAL